MGALLGGGANGILIPSKIIGGGGRELTPSPALLFPLSLHVSLLVMNY